LSTIHWSVHTKDLPRENEILGNFWFSFEKY
jgi:hypothetical protein